MFLIVLFFVYCLLLLFVVDKKKILPARTIDWWGRKKQVARLSQASGKQDVRIPCSCSLTTYGISYGTYHLPPVVPGTIKP